MADPPDLSPPSVERLPSYLAMLEAAHARGETGDGYTLVDPKPLHRDPAGYVHRLREIEAGAALPAGWVPMGTRWLVGSDGVVGECRIRHRLSPSLEIEGGHVGYFIHPEHRGQGLGRRILALALIELRRIGVTDVLVTCNADNERSRRVIEANGGTFDHYTTSPKSGKQVMRFWIRESKR